MVIGIVDQMDRQVTDSEQMALGARDRSAIFFRTYFRFRSMVTRKIFQAILKSNGWKIENI